MFPFPSALLLRSAAAGGGLGTTNMQYVGGTIASSTTRNSTFSASLTGLTGGISSTAAAGDLVIVSFAASGNADADMQMSTAGYTEVADLFSNNSADANLGVFYKKMGGTPDTSAVMVTSSEIGGSWAAVIHVWRAEDAVTQMDVTAVTDQGIGTNWPNPPAITPVTPGAVILVCGAGSAPENFNTPSDLSNFVTTKGDSTKDCQVGIGSKVWAGGAYDPVQWSSATNQGSGAWAAVTLALRPAVPS